MKTLAQCLAGYIPHEGIDLEGWIKKGIEAYESTEGVTVSVVKTNPLPIMTQMRDEEMHQAEETKFQKVLTLLQDAHCGGSSKPLGGGNYRRRVSLKQEPYMKAKDLLAQWNIEELKKGESAATDTDKAPADKVLEEPVDVVACGYEWNCLSCGGHNKEYEYRGVYHCSICGVKCRTHLPEHAIEWQ